MGIYTDIFKICCEHGIDFYSTLPCSHNIEFIQILENFDGNTIREDSKPLIHVPLVREESGVSINAGASLGGRKTAMVIQNQGLGNMVTQMLSLNSKLEGSYNIPNLLIISHRGTEKEKIDAQRPVGSKTEHILELCGFKYCYVKNDSDLEEFRSILKLYEKGLNVAILVKPNYEKTPKRIENNYNSHRKLNKISISGERLKTSMRRYQAISIIMDKLSKELVVANLGHPSRELYHIKDRKKNFYLTSCLGHSYTLALGLALACKEASQKVVCFEGDGGLLMNSGSLSIIGAKRPKNLILFLLDNGVWGSTGNTKTYASNGTNLSSVALAHGFPKSKMKVISEKKDLERNLIYALENEGPFFFHLIVSDVYKKMPLIPYSVIDIKKRFIKSIGSIL